jgi:uncharacterized membrane protein YeaQ/YmgE (transglycosylase-associated protein family)
MIGFLISGLLIGAIARLVIPGRQPIGLLMTMLLGAVGSIIGGTIANALRSGSVWDLNLVGFICAVAASVALIAIAERAGLGSGRRRDRLPRRT